MDIEEFISNTLNQIAKGLAKANRGSSLIEVQPLENGNAQLKNIKFSLCITVEKEGGLNLKIADAATCKTDVQRVDFDIDVKYYPQRAGKINP